MASARNRRSSSLMVNTRTDRHGLYIRIMDPGSLDELTVITIQYAELASLLDEVELQRTQGREPDPFDATWDTLAKNGECDARGGMEYERCRGAWAAKLSRIGIADFIRNEVNRPAELPELPELPDVAAAPAELPELPELPDVAAAPAELPELPDVAAIPAELPEVAQVEEKPRRRRKG
jgi:hypothetical protein